MLLQAPIQHRNFGLAINQAKTITTHGQAGAVVFVAGPSGAGKSTLKQHLANSLYGPPDKWPDNKTLLMSVRATNSEGGYFSSKDFFTRALTTLGDPFRGNTAETAAAAIVNGANSELLQFLSDPLWRSLHVAMTETKIRRAYECLASALGLKTLFIDEGQSMCLTHMNRSPSDHLESLKCLAEEIGIQIYIFGTYDLLEIWNHSSQLNRRTHLIHLARYNDSIDGDRDAFFAVLRMLGKALPLEDFSVFSEHAEEILRWTYGVFGEVEALLDRAQIAAFAEGKGLISWDHIKGAVYNPAQLKRLVDEISHGEARVFGALEKAQHNKPNANPSGRNRKPGRRNPSRDKCGKAA